MRIIVVLALIAAALAVENCPAFISTQDSSISYNIPAGWFNGTDQDGYEWYFSTCSNVDDSLYQSEKVAGDVSVYQVVKGMYLVKGTYDSRSVSDSPYGSSNGVEIMYAATVQGKSVKTIIELVCGTTEESIVVKVVDESTTVITYTSKNSCPVMVEVFDGPGFYATDDVEERTIVIPGAFIYFLFLCTSLLCVCCCCTCLIRRKKQQQRKDIQMKQFSSVAFQPIPAATKTTAAPQPTYNPYVPQPQFVYYYPSQNGSAPEFPLYTQQANSVVENTQNDEVIARNLQAQFDQEHV